MIEWFDSAILDWFLAHQNPVLTPVMHVFTLVGEGGILWIILGLILLIRKDTRKTGMVVILALLLCLLTCNMALKNIVARPRPFWRNTDVLLLIKAPIEFSFPSGHSTSSFAAAFSVLLWNRRWGIVAILTASLIAVSRIYFYVHYPTDVLAGALLGILIAVVAHRMICALEKKGVFPWLKVKKPE